MSPSERVSLMMRQGLNYAALANKCACSRGGVKKAMLGTQEPRNLRVEKHIATALRQDPVELFGPAPTNTLPTVTDTRWSRNVDA